MSYELKNSAHNTLQWSELTWWYLLNIAQRYGWQPMEAKTSARTSRSGGYFERSGQAVSAEDASALAGALESFYNDVCRDEIAGEVAERMRELLAGQSAANSQRFEVFTEPIETIGSARSDGIKEIAVWKFDEPSNERLLRFIDFCRKGAFTIQ